MNRMKKIAVLISAAVFALYGCVKPELDAPVAETAEYNAVLTAAMPSTKVAIDDECTRLTWSNGDRISVLTSKGVYKDFVYEGEDGVSSAQFKGILEDGESVAGYAIYPANSQHSVVDGAPQIYLPDTYEWKDAKVMGPMVAAIEGENASFVHAGGLFVFDVKNIPAGVSEFRFKTADKVVTGAFAYDDKIVAGEGEADQVSFSFDALSKSTDMKFHVPVPTGSYTGFTISYVRGGSDCEIKSATSTNEIELTTAKMFSVAIEGGSWYVTQAGTADADGYGWATATTLSNALAKAADGDVIYVGAGTYVPDTFISGKVADEDGNVALDEIVTASGEAQKAFIVDKNVTLLGGYPASGGDVCDPVTNKTVLSGNNVTNHVVVVCAPKADGKSVKVAGFTVSGASSNKTDDPAKWVINGTLLEDYTGAMAAVGSTLYLENMIFTANNTENASGIYVANSVADVRKCVFTANAAYSNGTVWFSENSEITFADSEISGNTANNAAGLYLFVEADTQLKGTISGITITGNTATTYGGGAYIRARNAGQKMDVTIDGCTISENASKEGASMKLLNVAGVSVNNTIMRANTGGAAMGGVLMSEDASVTYNACSFLDNVGNKEAATIIKAGTVETTNKFDRCIWKGNTSTSWGTVYVLASSTYADNVFITNSLFDGNSAKGRGGAIYARATGAGGTNVSCVNTTFHNNDTQNAAHGTAVLAYSGNAANVATINLISCTVTGNHSTAGHYAVYAENAGSVVNLYNSLIANNIGTNDRYNVGSGSNGVKNQYSCQNGATYYDAEGKNAGSNTFDYTTMLGALTTDGVCPLLLPDTNPAYTGGMTSEELSALASTNVPATVLTKDQLGNDRTGTVIGAWTPVAAN